MSCVVGLETEDGAWIGTDSQVTSSYGKWTLDTDTSKLFVRGPFLVGCCGSNRVAQVIKYTLGVPPHYGVKDVAFLVRSVIPKLREALKINGTMHTEDGEDASAESSVCLIAYRGKIYGVYEDFSVLRDVCGYNAAGSGGEVARGALYATSKRRMSAEKRVAVAIEAAAEHSPGVGLPAIIKFQKKCGRYEG